MRYQAALRPAGRNLRILIPARKVWTTCNESLGQPPRAPLADWGSHPAL
jgi:hypothetical protein